MGREAVLLRRFYLGENPPKQRPNAQGEKVAVVVFVDERPLHRVVGMSRRMSEEPEKFPVTEEKLDQTKNCHCRSCYGDPSKDTPNISRRFDSLVRNEKDQTIGQIGYHRALGQNGRKGKTIPLAEYCVLLSAPEGKRL